MPPHIEKYQSLCRAFDLAVAQLEVAGVNMSTHDNPKNRHAVDEATQKFADAKSTLMEHCNAHGLPHVMER